MDWRTILCIIWLGIAQGIVHGQNQVTVATPYHTSSDRFFSSLGTNFSFRQVSPSGGVFFRHGGFGPGPVFGGFDPGSQSSFGFGGRRGNASWNLGFSFGQGSSQSSVSTTASLTMPHGGFGFINHSSQRPFVTGFIPVVGGRRISPLEERLARLKFQAAVKTAKSKREQAEADEIRNARRASANSVSRYPKPDDPPLILGQRR